MISRKNLIQGIVFAVWFLGILIGFLAINVYCSRESAKERTYYFDEGCIDSSQDGLSIKVAVSKQWHDEELHAEIPVGAQYDGILNNSSGRTFKDWSVDLVFSENVVIDSSWNGDFEAVDNKIKFVAQGNPRTVNKRSMSTFGSVMYSKKLLELKSYTLKGYSVINIFDLRIFWVMVVLTALFMFCLAIQIIIRMHEKSYMVKQELDSKIIKQSMNTFIGFIDAKDSYTKGHSSRVATYACEIARRMKMKPDEVERLYYITLMHDCGKIGIPDSVLKKPGKLTADEYNIVKSHTTMGDKILVNFTAIPGIRDGAHFHHERYDGKGYPSGLKGEDIPLYARIICVADSYDAMSSNRCYRTQLEKETILDELKNNAGTQFDPEIVKYMVDMINDGFTDSMQE